MRLVARGLAPVALLALVPLVGLVAGSASAGVERIREFDVDLHLATDGTFGVDEHILYDFGPNQRRGIYRDIPVRYGRGAAADYRIALDVESVTDEHGNERPIKITNEGRNRRIRIGDPDRRVTGEHEYRIRYRVRRGILWFDDHDEVYWNVTGTEWPVPIDEATATVYLPQGIEGEVRFLCFTGPMGSVETACTGERRDDVITVSADRGFQAKEGLTVVVSLPKGVIQEPGRLRKLLDRASDWVSFATVLPFALFVLLGCIWWVYGRDPAGAYATPVRYEPPDGMTPAEMGTVLDEKVDMIDITATILDLAVRGYLQIEERETQKFLFLSSTDYTLHRGARGTLELKAHERALLDGLFGGLASVDLSDLRAKFYTRLPGIRDALYKEVSRKGRWFPARPDHVRTAYAVGAFVLGIPAVVAAFVLEDPPLWVSAIVCILVAVRWSRYMPRKTRKGRRARQHILGFKEFVERVEKDRLERLGMRDVSQFEKLLPYAFVLGVADPWAEAFADLYTRPPDWYVGYGDGPFRPHHFVSRLGHSLDTVGSVMQSTPSRGSGGSGFSGGGSSGGGFGGGGGGSW